MDETPNVNNLNGVPNFGHGLPEEVSQTDENETQVETSEVSEGEQGDEGVQEGEPALGKQAGAESEVEETGDSDSSEPSGTE